MKGSKNCIAKLIESENFVKLMNSLVRKTGAVISPCDNWMPKGVNYNTEAELKDFLKYNFEPNLSKEIVKWWLEVDATTPNWDLISTCTIGGKKGLVLVEAKAHYNELANESKGKGLDTKASENSKSNHAKIAQAISDVNAEINKTVTGVSISRDCCYQLSNRVAHAWWLANHGIPVVLLYLGFLKVEDMRDGKNIIFETESDWEKCFIEHAKKVGVDRILDKWIDCGNSSFITICRSIQL
jgi:hypothetical protein